MGNSRRDRNWDGLLAELGDVPALRALILSGSDIASESACVSREDIAGAASAWLGQLVRTAIVRRGIRDPHAFQLIFSRVITELRRVETWMRFEAGRPLSSYVYGLVNNLSLEFRREITPREADALRFLARVDVAECPLDVLCRKEGLNALKAEFDRLSSEERALLVRRFGPMFGECQGHDGGRWTEREYMKLHRILRRLRDRLEGNVLTNQRDLPQTLFLERRSRRANGSARERAVIKSKSGRRLDVNESVAGCAHRGFGDETERCADDVHFGDR